MLQPFNVRVTMVGVEHSSDANLVLRTDFNSAAGNASQGVLGSIDKSDTVQVITLLQGWDWYTGTSPMEVAPGQYDLQTIVTHELGHALGLGHSVDVNSVMHATLQAGEVHRHIVTADLQVADVEDVDVHALLAGSFAGNLASEMKKSFKDQAMEADRFASLIVLVPTRSPLLQTCNVRTMKKDEPQIISRQHSLKESMPAPTDWLMAPAGQSQKMQHQTKVFLGKMTNQSLNDDARLVDALMSR